MDLCLDYSLRAFGCIRPRIIKTKSGASGCLSCELCVCDRYVWHVFVMHTSGLRSREYVLIPIYTLYMGTSLTRTPPLVGPP